MQDPSLQTLLQKMLNEYFMILRNCRDFLGELRYYSLKSPYLSERHTEIYRGRDEMSGVL